MNLNLGFLDLNKKNANKPKQSKAKQKRMENTTYSWNNTNDTHVYRNLAEKKFIVHETVLFTADLMHAILIVP